MTIISSEKEDSIGANEERYNRKQQQQQSMILNTLLLSRFIVAALLCLVPTAFAQDAPSLPPNFGFLPCSVCDAGFILLDPLASIPAGTVTFVDEELTCLAYEQLAQDAQFSPPQCSELRNSAVPDLCNCRLPPTRPPTTRSPTDPPVIPTPSPTTTKKPSVVIKTLAPTTRAVVVDTPTPTTTTPVVDETLAPTTTTTTTTTALATPSPTTEADGDRMVEVTAIVNNRLFGVKEEMASATIQSYLQIIRSLLQVQLSGSSNVESSDDPVRQIQVNLESQTLLLLLPQGQQQQLDGGGDSENDGNKNNSTRRRRQRHVRQRRQLQQEKDDDTTFYPIDTLLNIKGMVQFDSTLRQDDNFSKLVASTIQSEEMTLIQRLSVILYFQDVTSIVSTTANDIPPIPTLSPTTKGVPPPTDDNENDENENENGLSNGAIAGIVVGAVVFFVVVSVYASASTGKKKKNDNKKQEEEETKNNIRVQEQGVKDDLAGGKQYRAKEEEAKKSYGNNHNGLSSSLLRQSMVSRTVMAPPGKLGIIIDTTLEGPVVHKVNPQSPLEGSLFPGDIIVGIDDVDTRAMSASAITALMVRKASQGRETKLRVLQQPEDGGSTDFIPAAAAAAAASPPSPTKTTTRAKVAEDVKKTNQVSSNATSSLRQNMVSRTIIAKPGKLGITIDTTLEGPVVYKVNPGSSLEGSLFPGNIIVAIDDVDLRPMSASAITALMVRKATQGRETKLQVLQQQQQQQQPQQPEEDNGVKSASVPVANIKEEDVKKSHVGATESGNSQVSSNAVSSLQPTANMVSRTIIAKPGKLGIVIDTTLEGPVVHKVNPGSPLEGSLFPGNIIVAIDDVDLRKMSASAITALMVRKASQGKETKLTALQQQQQEQQQQQQQQHEEKSGVKSAPVPVSPKTSPTAPTNDTKAGASIGGDDDDDEPKTSSAPAAAASAKTGGSSLGEDDSLHDADMSYAYSLDPGNVEGGTLMGSVVTGTASNAGGTTQSGSEVSSHAMSSLRQNMVSRTVMAQPGKLGIVIDTTLEGPVVHKVNPGSPLEGSLFPGDIIVAIDDVDTRAMSASAITGLMVKTAHKRRKLTVLSEDITA